MTHCTDGKTFRLHGKASTVLLVILLVKATFSNRTEGLCVHTSYMRCLLVYNILYKKLTKSHVLNGHLSPTTLNLFFCCCMDTYIIVVDFMVQPHKIV